MKKIIFFCAFLVPFVAGAQTYTIDATNDPVPVIRPEVRKLPEAARTKDTVLPTPNFTYGIQSKRFVTSFGLDTIKAAKLGSEPLPKLYKSYAKIGVGNYSTFLGEINVMSGRSKVGAWGIHAGHISAGSGPKDVAGEFAGYSSQNVDLFGKRYVKKHVLSGNFGYNRDVVYNYGSPIAANVFTKDYSKQKYNFFSVGGGVKSFYSDSTAINHDVQFGYNYFDNKLGVSEDRILINANGGRYIRTEYLDASFGVDYNRVSGLADTLNSTIIKLVPRFTARGNKLVASAGIGLYHETNGEGATYFYPQAYFSYDIFRHYIIPYVSLSGSLERNNYRSLSMTNPFVSSAVAGELRNTQHLFELEIGLKGTLSSEVFYQISASRYQLKDAPFYVNTSFSQDVMQNKFDVIYDTADVVHVGGQIGWQQMEKIKLIVGGDWYQYSMETSAHPWHTPTLKLNVLASYNLQNKVLVHSELYYLNGQYALVNTGAGNATVNLKGLVDLNLGVEYRYTKFLSLYVDFRNLAGQRYQRWNAFPTQQFNLIGGLSYTF